MNTQENSKWNVDVPWREGTEDDFVELREHLAKVKVDKDNGDNGKDTDSESDDTDTEIIEEFVNIGEKSKPDSDDSENNFDEDKLVERFHNQFEDNESESEDEPDEDPGPDHPSRRLLWAAQHNHLDILKAIVKDKPGLLGVKDEDGYTPLHRASYSGNIEAVRELLNSGADPSATTVEGWTPLHSACRWNQAAAAELLLSHGAPLNQVTQGGQTALHLAAFGTNSRNTLELLLSQPSVDGTLVNCQGDTARDISIRNGLLSPLFDAILPSPVQKYKEK